MDNSEKILQYLEQENKISFDNSFMMLSYCTKLLSQHTYDTDNEARRIVIHVLNNWNKISELTYEMWTTLIESLGFYPYVHKNDLETFFTSCADDIRMKYYQSDYLDDMYLHKEQKKISEYILEGKSVIASAPTSFGKSLLIEEIVASKKYKNIIVIQPTLALLDETRIKLKKYSDAYKIIVRTSQEISEDKGNLFLLTAERVMEYNPLPKIDFLIIDEFYKLSLKRDDERVNTLNNAFLKVVNKFNPQFYLLGPNIDGITKGFAERYNAVFFKSDFSLVDCNVIDKSFEIDWSQSSTEIEKSKKKLLFELLDELKDDQTLIYCSNPSRCRKIAREYYQHIKNRPNVTKELPLVPWLRKNVSPEWSLVKELPIGIAVHDGSLQKHIGASIIKYFNEGKINYIFCTSTIIEGVNTSAKNVIYYDEKKGPNQIDFFDYSNIKGRSGRMMEHYVGNVYNFSRVPEREAVIVDIPFFEQDPKLLSDEILINIMEKDVKQQVKDRYDRFSVIPEDVMKLIRQNGVSVDGQLNIYKRLASDIKQGKQLKNIQWSRMPNWDQIEYILDIAFENLFDFSTRKGVHSVKQLTQLLNVYRSKKSIMPIVDNIYNYKKGKVSSLTEERKRKYYDEAIEEAFHVYRHWFLFTVPKVFRVVDSIQRNICEKLDIKPGSYSYFVHQLENDFIRENLSILVEFGVPSNAVRRLEEMIPDSLPEDEVIDFIVNNRRKIEAVLLPYERERLNSCI